MKILILTLPNESHVKPIAHFIRSLCMSGNDITIYIREQDRKHLPESNLLVKYYSDYFMDNIYNMNYNVSHSLSSEKLNEEAGEIDFNERAGAFAAAYLFRIRCSKKYISNLN